MPWERSLAGPQKVWFAIYEPGQERRLRFRIDEVETATRNAGHDWCLIDLTDTFATWMANHPYRDAYFDEPELLESALEAEFSEFVIQRVKTTLEDSSAN